MISRLIILLLIVGCAHKPPSAQFYIGMNTEDFINKNRQLKGFNTGKNKATQILRSTLGNDNYHLMTSDRERGIFRFYYEFYDDTLTSVYHGTFNYIFSKQEINYEKYTILPK